MRRRSTPSAPIGRLLLAAGAASTILTAGGVGYSLRRINRIREFSPEQLRALRGEQTNPLLASFPALANRLPWRSLGSFPTAVEEFPDLETGDGVRLFVKRDDLSSDLYGGNKVRKLEFILAEAELASRRTLITLGGIGSNHALAVAMHGAARGFDVDLVLYDQPVLPIVRRNLGGFLAAGARLHYAGSKGRAFAEAGRLFARRSRQGADPYFIMVGGSSRLGCMGYVDAGLELYGQIAAGKLPEPDRIFVPLGTCGTAAGLIVGLRLAGLNSRVVAVRVAEAFPANAAVLRRMAQDTADFLHGADPSIPRLRLTTEDFDVVPDYLGKGYGYPTREARRAVAEAAPRLTLETTYTGKTMAACMAFCREAAKPTNVLFWNTFSSAPVPEPEDWERLPEALRPLIH